jgi:UDP-4-amino-4-deoxy-L-arabinose formyltransferase/UDP-glucuronic acid dehydrogenase (UDP-4-keto-hexauronic acid decarboxylating)
MRVAIIGRTSTLIASARKLAEAGHAIALVATARPAPEYASGEQEFAALAAEHGATFLSAATLTREALAAVSPGIDVAISLNYPTVIDQPAIDIFRLGILNAHGGDLPRYRGNACQAWALLRGERRIGLCVHRMVGGDVDAGDIVVRRYLDVTIDSRVGEVMAWMEREVPTLFVEAVARVGEAGAVFERQDPAAALRCYPRRPEDGRIDWRADRETVLRLINASSEPYGGAFTTFRGDKLVVWRAVLAPEEGRYLAVPGQIARIDRAAGTADILTGGGAVRLIEVEIGGVRGTPAAAFKSTRERLV